MISTLRGSCVFLGRELTGSQDSPFCSCTTWFSASSSPYVTECSFFQYHQIPALWRVYSLLYRKSYPITGFPFSKESKTSPNPVFFNKKRLENFGPDQRCINIGIKRKRKETKINLKTFFIQNIQVLPTTADVSGPLSS